MWIKRRLGDGVICVELTDEQLDVAILTAKDFWRAWVGQPKMVFLTTTGTSEIAEADIASDIDCVVDVTYPVSDDLTRLFSWADVEVNPYTWVYTGYGGYSTIVQLMQYRELGKRVVSSDLDWEWDRARRLLLLAPPPDGGQRVGVVYLSTEVDMRRLSNTETWLFREYALVQAMKILAMIRTKYSDKPSATGSFGMDGDGMYANAEAKEQELTEKIRQIQMPVGFLTG
ncbi:MAG: hypothetical protein WC683_01950 [bacterium]